MIWRLIDLLLDIMEIILEFPWEAAKPQALKLKHAGHGTYESLYGSL